MSFWKEFKRQNAYKVDVAYTILAWLLIQFVAIDFPHLDFPSRAFPFVIIILIVVFPLKLLSAWAFEISGVVHILFDNYCINNKQVVNINGVSRRWV